MATQSVPIWAQKGVTLDGLRSLLASGGAFIQCELVRYGSGFALGLVVHQGAGVARGLFLAAEKSRQVRVFARAETAFKLMEDLGFSVVTVRLNDHGGGRSIDGNRGVSR